jgi:hypothetical protein
MPLKERWLFTWHCFSRLALSLKKRQSTRERVWSRIQHRLKRIVLCILEHLLERVNFWRLGRRRNSSISLLDIFPPIRRKYLV